MKFLSFLLSLFLLSACNSSDDDDRGKHESSATVEMHPSPVSAQNENFVKNQFTILQTDHILGATAEELKIELDALRKAVNISQLQEHGFIKVTAHHDNEDLPRLFITALLDNYSQFRKNQETKWAKDQLEVLAEEAKKQKMIIDEAQRELVSNPIVGMGIPEFDSQSSEEEILEKAERRFARLEEQAALIKTQITNLEQLDEEQLLLYAADLDLPHNQVAVHYDQYKEAVANRQRLLDQGLGLTHPDTEAVEEKMRTLLDKAKNECRSLLETLKVKQELVGRKLKKLQRDDESESPALLRQKFTQSHEKYEDARILLRELQIRKMRMEAFFEGPENFFTIHEWEHK